MKKRTNLFLIGCFILATISLAAATYKESVILGIAGGLISGYIIGVIDKYCN